MKPNGLAAYMADLAVHLLVGCVVAFLVFAALRATRAMVVIEHQLAASFLQLDCHGED